MGFIGHPQPRPSQDKKQVGEEKKERAGEESGEEDSPLVEGWPYHYPFKIFDHWSLTAVWLWESAAGMSGSALHVSPRGTKALAGPASGRHLQCHWY